MADENISVNVDDGGVIDAYLAKLDSALAKSSQLTGAPVATDGAGTKDVIVNVDNQVLEARKKADALLKNEGTQIKGLESSMGRIARMIPGLREARRLQVGLENLQAGSLIGVVGIVMLAYSIYRQIMAYYDDLKREQAQFRSEVMQAQNFTTFAQFESWDRKRQQALDYYRSQATY
jgi:hypothetical protein